jgi:son of sevenless-like protein
LLGLISLSNLTPLFTSTTLLTYALTYSGGNRDQLIIEGERPAQCRLLRARMDNYTGTITPPGMFVRALYDYNADDRTSLSFYQGEIIQVLTQLESGWWDGVIHGKRGWFPSNYCTVVSSEEARDLEEDGDFDTSRTEFEELSEDNYEDENFAAGLQGQLHQFSTQRSQHAVQRNGHEEAEFWIPQATPDGRLFYFNTLTGITTMELPLESPLSSDPHGSRGSSTFFTNNHTNTPNGFFADESERDDTDVDLSASETDDPSNPETSRTSRVNIEQRLCPSVTN